VLHAALKNAFGSKLKDSEYLTYKNIKNVEKRTMNRILKQKESKDGDSKK